MSLALTKIKSRIKSVSSAYKVTNAMKLVSTVKLSKWKNKMNESLIYTTKLKEISDIVFLNAKKNELNLFTKNNDVDKKLYIAVTSSLGLCGSYNVNMFNFIESKVNEQDDVIILGSKGISHFSNSHLNLINDFNDYSSIKDEKIFKRLLNFSIESFINGKYKEVHILYTHFKNTITFIPQDFQLFPFKADNDKALNENHFAPLFEPSTKELIEKLVPLVIENEFYSKLLEAEVSEQASRCNAMDNATNNAEELLNELNIDFNKARQTAITQEIIEIVAASKN